MVKLLTVVLQESQYELLAEMGREDRLTPSQVLDSLGVFNGRTLAAHGVWLTDGDIQILKTRGVGVAHCPSSNMRLGAGACRVEDLVRAGARVGLGVDGSASNEDANIAVEIHQALYLARARAALLNRGDAPKAFDARGAWRLATRGGAECLGRDDCGTLEVGKCADVALFRVDDLAHAGMPDRLAGLALAPPARASIVIVNGRVVVFDGRLLTADEDEIAREIAATSARLAG